MKYHQSSDSFSLAKFGLSGYKHAPDCQYYSVGGDPVGRGGSGIGVLDAQTDGSVRIRLEISMTVREGVEQDNTSSTEDRPDRPSSTRQSAIKLAGLLHYL